MTKKADSPQGLTIDFDGAGKSLVFARPTFAMMKRVARKAIALEQTLSMVQFYEHADDVHELLRHAAKNEETRVVVNASFQETDDDKDRPDNVLDYAEIMEIWDGWYKFCGFDRFLVSREREREARRTEEQMEQLKRMKESGMIPENLLQDVMNQEFGKLYSKEPLETILDSPTQTESGTESEKSSESETEPPTSTSST